MKKLLFLLISLVLLSCSKDESFDYSIDYSIMYGTYFGNVEYKYYDGKEHKLSFPGKLIIERGTSYINFRIEIEKEGIYKRAESFYTSESNLKIVDDCITYHEQGDGRSKTVNFPLDRSLPIKVRKSSGSTSYTFTEIK